MATHARAKLPPELKKQSHESWSMDEVELVQDFFANTWTLPTLYQKLFKLNPQRTYESIGRKVRRMRAEGWVRDRERALDKLRVGYFDIEASHLKANFGFIICWYIKKAGTNHYDHAIVTKDELFSLKRDRRILGELFDAFDNYDVIYGHYARRFDIPFIKTRAIILGMEDRINRPLEKFLMDTWEISRKNLALSSNRLDTLAQAFQLKDQKTGLMPTVWNDAVFGEPKALKYVDTHCKADVDVLEGVHKKLMAVEYPKKYQSL